MADYSYAIPGGAHKFENDIGTRFVQPYENYLTRKQQQDEFNARLMENRRIENANALKDALKYNPHVIRSEYQPYISDQVQNQFYKEAQKVYSGNVPASAEAQSKLYSIQNNIEKQVNMVNDLDAKVQGIAQYMDQTNKELKAQGLAPEFDETHGYSELNKLFKNDDGTIKKPEEIDFNKLDTFLDDPRVNNLGAQNENWFTGLPKVASDILQEVPSASGNSFWKLMGVEAADIFQMENKNGQMVIKKDPNTGNPVIKAGADLAALQKYTNPTLYDRNLTEAKLENVPVADVIKRNAGLYFGKAYSEKIQKFQNIPNPQNTYSTKQGEHQADISERVKYLTTGIINKDSSIIGIIKAKGKYNGHDITGVQYIDTEGTAQSGDSPNPNAIKLTYTTDVGGFPRKEQRIFRFDSEQDLRELWAQLNSIQNSIDEGTGKSITFDEFQKELHTQYPNGVFGQNEPQNTTSPTGYTAPDGKKYNKQQLIDLGYTEEQIQQAIKQGTLK